MKPHRVTLTRKHTGRWYLSMTETEVAVLRSLCAWGAAGVPETVVEAAATGACIRLSHAIETGLRNYPVLNTQGNPSAKPENPLPAAQASTDALSSAL
jgi:hypothetical protein